MNRDNKSFVLLSHVTEFGGAEKVLLMLGDGLKDNNIQVTFVLPQGEHACRIGSHRNHLVPPLAKKNNPNILVHVWRVLLANFSVVKTFREDRSCLVYNSPRAFVYFLLSSFFVRGDKICFLHEVLRPPTIMKLLLPVMSACGVKLFAVSEKVAQSAQLNSVRILKNPVPVNKNFSGRSPSVKVKIGIIANIAECKGQLFAIEAIEPLLRSDEKISYEIYGRVLDPAEHEYSVQLNDRANKVPGVTLCGYTEDPLETYRHLDIMIQSSLFSEQPLSLTEAISSGNMVVVPRGGGEESQVGKWPHVIWYQRNDLQSLRDAVVDAVQLFRKEGVTAVQKDYDCWALGRTRQEWLGSFIDTLEVN